MEKLLIGSHVSFKKDTQLLGSVEEALSYGANTLMLYTGAPQNTARSEINSELTTKADELLKINNIDKSKIIVHGPYIINLANGDPFAVNFLKEEVKRCETLGLYNLVLHPGSHVKLTREEGINNIINGLNEILKEETKVNILLETMAGKGTEIGINLEEIKTIMDGVKHSENLKVCIDTCHLNDSGIKITEFDKYLEEFDKVIGINKIACVHINDSKNELGVSKDRHENFGFGTLGFDTLIKVIYNEKLKNVPKILETPYVTKTDLDKERLYPPYKHEIEMIKNKTFNPNLIEEIRNYYR